METYKVIEFEHVTKEDIEALTPFMKRAFDEDTRRHLGEVAGGPKPDTITVILSANGI